MSHFRNSPAKAVSTPTKKLMIRMNFCSLKFIRRQMNSRSMKVKFRFTARMVFSLIS